MSDQTTKNPDDAFLIEFFKNFETMLSPSKAERRYSGTADFKVFSEFLIKDIGEMKVRLKDADNEYFYYACRHIFNILDWIRLIVDAGFITFRDAFEQLFEDNYKDRHILQNMYDACFEKWISQKRGQYEIGENFYNVIDGKLYYHNRRGQWFEVDRKTAFDLKPDQILVEDGIVISQLDGEYKETWYDSIIKRWENKKYQGVLADDFLQFNDKETSPEAYFDFTIEHIKTLLKNPVSVTELERFSGGEDIDIEYLVKICVPLLDIVKKRRNSGSHTLFLLRDCVLFYEAQKTVDILCGEDTSADQILVGRKLLSHKPGQWGYYAVMLEALYIAHDRCPTNFDDFYNEYARLLDMFVSLNSEFGRIITDIADYIKQHIKTDKNKIVVFDIGFQGSIALLTKYIIDRHIKPSGPGGKKIETDIKIGVGAVWSKELFGDRYESDYFPFLNRVQLMARSDELYHYKEESLNAGKLQVIMGDKKWQQKATIELVVLVIVALLSETDK